MARLPTVGGDAESWGTLLNEYLQTSHNPDGTLKLDVKTIADLKSIDVTTLADKQQALVAGYYTHGDGGGGQFYYDAGASVGDNGGTVIAPTAGAGRWKRIYSGVVNAKWYGAKADGAADDTAALTAALATIGPKGLFLPSGRYRITSALNLTNRFGPYVVSGEGWTTNGIGSIVYPETGGIAFDCTGSSYISLRDICINTYGRTNPATVGVLWARSTTPGYEYSQFNTMTNVLIRMQPNMSANNGKGTIGIYNKAAEQHDYHNINVVADTPLVFTGLNPWGITSAYATINDAITSCSVLTVGGGASTLAARGAGCYAAYLSGAYAVTFANTYFQHSGFLSGNNKGIYLSNSHKVDISGNFEEMNSIAYIRNVSNVTIDVGFQPKAYVPIDVAASCYVENLLLRVFVVGGAATTWPRIFECGSGAYMRNLAIEVTGDNGSVPLANIADVRGISRKIASTTSNGSVIFERGAVTFAEVSSAGVPNGSIFMDAADGKIKLKDGAGNIHEL